MRRALLLCLLLAGCAREVDLGFDDGGHGVPTFTCSNSADCSAGFICVDGACQSQPGLCGSDTVCGTSQGPVCTDAQSCPTCDATERCCVDNGFGQCQCYCGLSCSGPACAAAGQDAGALGTTCITSDDCLCGESCVGGTCRVGSIGLASCASDLGCSQQGCGDRICVGATCVPRTWRCVNSRECGGSGQGYQCLGGSCTCVDESPATCTQDSDCTPCTGKLCRSGFCSIFTTTGGTTGGNATGTTTGATTSGTTGASSAGSTGGSGSIGGSSGSTGTLGGSSAGSTSGSGSGSTG